MSQVDAVGTGSGYINGLDPAQMQQKRIEVLKQKFGEEAIDQVTNDDGTLDRTKLLALIQAQGTDTSQPDMANPTSMALKLLGGANSQQGLSGTDSEVGTLLDALKNKLESGQLDLSQFHKSIKDNFSGMASDIIGEDGSIDFDKLQQLFLDQISQKGKGVDLSA